MLIWTLVALGVAAVVVLVASRTASDRRDGPTFVHDFRAGWSARRHPDAEQVAAALAAELEPVDVPLDEFLRVTAVEDDGYLQVDEVLDVLLQARDKAFHSVQELGRHPG